ncbi:twin-arginine translocase subunit TatC [bacterium]|nr:twin-arginine translocase subunit TatC [bacterium]
MALDQVDVDQQEATMSFFEHLEALRWHIMRALIAVGLGAIFAFVKGTYIFDHILLGPARSDFWSYKVICDLSYMLYDSDKICIGDIQFNIQQLKLTEQFYQHLVIAFVGGAILAFPYILYEVYRFVKPALKKSEKRYSGLAILSASVLFFSGVLFGYYILSPISINFLGNYTLSEIVIRQFTITSIIGFVLMLSIGAGIMFELPLVVYFLAKVGLVTSATLKQYRKVALVVILVVSAIVTPPDVASQILLSIPILLLYELGIFIASKVELKYD